MSEARYQNILWEWWDIWLNIYLYSSQNAQSFIALYTFFSAGTYHTPEWFPLLMPMGWSCLKCNSILHWGHLSLNMKSNSRVLAFPWLWMQASKVENMDHMTSSGKASQGALLDHVWHSGPGIWVIVKLLVCVVNSLQPILNTHQAPTMQWGRK